MFVKIPEDVNDPKSVEFFKMLESIVNLMEDEEFKDRLFGKNAKLYKYNKLVKKQEETETGKIYHRFVKIKISHQDKRSFV